MKGVNLLLELTEGARADAEARRAELSYEALEERARAARQPIDVAAALAHDPGHTHVIAEIKRSSPSKGALAEITDPAALASEYAAGGASCISVLTESRRFGGSLDDLRAVRARVDVPLLRKDFISDEYQLLEARDAGADMVLLIVAVLQPERLRELHAFALDLGLSALVEVHDPSEIEHALAADARILGVNTRDLKTFEMHPERFAQLRSQIPAGVVAVAESGVSQLADVERYRADGADAVLIGEALVRDGEPQKRVREFGAVR
ncbi:indole-3-glycerol phosphate synthase TrpC [Agrococcus casei]|uniref:Indole-3-glycerol phosphate synthase n=1 Tax=Agrococcus casei LMG 22410 TaxID=1255656 RepID=A0A1R4FQG0_9MICO|nr:indole-3-glycerol phosphate synthase TrpC [Agrococcus casei]SJM58270.1 Indole-3-glycerol phosphate synthase [Agrococcus casei LMG 22410]